MAKNNFGLFFSRDSTVIRLPVNPEKLPVTRETDNGDYNVLGIGQIMVPRTPKLRTVTISSFFPGRVFPGVLTSGAFQPPAFYISFFESAMEDKAPILYTPVRFYEDGESFSGGDTGMACLVTGLETEERGAETGDFYYTLTLTEYRDYSPGTMQIKRAATASAASVATTEPERTVPKGQLVVGSVCAANGKYYASSYGDGPHGNGNGRRVVISRIADESRAYPYHVKRESGGALGWMKKTALQVVSGG